MKGFPIKTPLKPFVEVKFEDGEDFISSFPYNHIKNFSIEIGGKGEMELELYDAEGRISAEVVKATDKNGGRFASGKKIQVRWGWKEGLTEITSKEHKVTILRVKTEWNISTGFVFTLQGVPFGTEKKNLKGSYSGPPHEAIKKLMTEAFAGEGKVGVKFIKGKQESDGADFFENEEVTAEGEGRDWETILQKILSRCKIESGDKIYYHRNTATNQLIISDFSKNKAVINDDFFDGKSFEFGRLPSGSKTYLTELNVNLDNTLLALSGGIRSEGITSESTEEEEGDVGNETVGVSGDVNTAKTGDVEGKGVEENEGKLGSASSKAPDKSTVEVTSASAQKDDPDLAGGRTPAEVSKAITQQIQRTFNRLASNIEATFIGNPKWDDAKYIGGARMKFDVYTASMGKAGESLNKILSIEAEAMSVIHSIQNGQYFCTFPDLSTQKTS